MKRTWSIFGCGPGGLYSAWRLVTSKKIQKGDTLSLYEWARYQLEGVDSGTRSAGGRVCSHHYKGNPLNSYIEVGGMRYIHWDHNDPKGAGHRLVTTVIEKLKLEGNAEPFNTTNDPLFYLRQRNFYSSDISSTNPAPYNADHCVADFPPVAGTDSAYNYVANQSLGENKPKTRDDQYRFYKEGTLPESFQSDVFKPGDLLRNIGYWNLTFDQLGGEGYRYAAEGGGYEANVINWNSADALIYNSEFTPGGEFKTLKTGYSSIYPAMFEEISSLCRENGIHLDYRPGTRLRSIWLDPDNANKIMFTLASDERPDRASETGTTDCAFLAMPPGSLDIVAEASRYSEENIVDVLNADKVALYRESVIMQPSYKVAMFFDTEWWKESDHPPRLDGDPSNIDQKTQQANVNVYGPTITDTPLRQVYYFGNNALDSNEKVYGILASYDDERFVRFWQELELGPDEDREIPLSRNLQPLEGASAAPDVMVNMLRSQLARVHWGEKADASKIPEPLETVYMDWSLKPFSAGYHAWAPHFEINDVMQKIRKPTELIDGVDADLFIVGSAYSNDQAWVEGAFCTAESVLVDFLDTKELICQENYPFICRCKPISQCSKGA